MSTRTSNNYVATLDPMSVNDMQTLELIRKTVKIFNQQSKEGFPRWKQKLAPQKRVRVCGRKPKEKMDIYGRGRMLGYDWAGNIAGGLANATQYDVYIYEV